MLFTFAKIRIYILLNKLLNLKGYSIISSDYFIVLEKIKLEKRLLDYGIIKNNNFNYFLNSVDFNKIKSKLGQDLFTLIILDYKRDGYFVEFGALDGINGSNSFLLESIGWNGVLVEPSKDFKYVLKNRSVQSYNLAVYSESNLNMEFLYSRGLSTLLPYKNSDNINRVGKTHKVRTITLVDLLQIANSPSYIDYISIDTEGSEFEILSAFDFNKYRFGIITVEHNYVEDRRNDIHNLLSKNDYVRVLYNLTEVDDWYLDKNLFVLKKQFFNL